MTVMDPRPWSPASPHIGPDDEDLAMLDPTGDPEVDLGSAVLAVHRVGAAACEAVARAPLPDEYRLIDALATARAASAAPVVEAVSKCVSSENARGYADLLLRDLFDDGERGALAVYRACVSKGVAPPLAAQRAGLVYGVPHGELGRYLSVATEPKSHPVAIADAADRAVTRWASGVVREEMSTAVSKAVAHETVEQYNATPFGQEHPKGRAGRFVETLERERHAPSPLPVGEILTQQPGLLARLRRDSGVGGQAAPEVATMPAPPVMAPTITAPVPARVQRRQKRQKRQRTTRDQVRAPIKSVLRSTLSARLSSRVQSSLNAQRLRPTGAGDVGTSEVDASREFTEKLGNTYLAWATDVGTAGQLFARASGQGTYDKPKHMKMGDLQQHFIEPKVWGATHRDAMRTIAEDASGAEAPRALRIDAEELEEAGIHPLDVSSEEGVKRVAGQVEEFARMKGYYDQLAREEDGTYNPLLKGVMSVSPDAQPGTGDWFLVVEPRTALYRKPDEIPLTAAAELVVSDPNSNVARVNRVVDDEGVHYELDPTQDWIIKEPTTLWRQTGMDAQGNVTGHWVDRYTVEPLADDWNGGKAVTVQERWRTEPRNDLGEWSRTSGGLLARVKQAPVAVQPTVVTPTVTPIRPKVQQRQRVQRKQKRTAVASQIGSTVSGGTVKSTLSTQLNAQLKAAFEAKIAEEDAPPKSVGFPVTLDDRPIHRVLSPKQWAEFLAAYAPTSYADDVRGIDLPGRARLAFAEASGALKLRDGDEVNAKLRTSVIREINEDPENRLVEIPAFRRRISPIDPDAANQLTEEIFDYMEGHPDVAHMQISRDENGGPWDLTVYRNLKPVRDQVLIYTEDDIDWERPVSLVWVGKARRADLNRGRHFVYDRGDIIDAPVSVYRAEQRIWRAHQGDDTVEFRNVSGRTGQFRRGAHQDER